VGDISAQLAATAVDPLLELGPVRVDHHRPARRVRTQPARFAGGDVADHRVVVAAGQLGRVPVAPGQIERFKDLHDLLGRLHSSPFSPLSHVHAQ
jgi:hypothetical protein